MVLQIHPGTGPFVGRESELGRILPLLDRVMHGDCAVVVLAGEPGIGKTRLAEEVARVAAERDMRVLWGRCYEDDGAPSYWPWIQIIRAYSQERNPDRLRTELGVGAPAIVRLVPELAEIVGGQPEPPQLEAEQARFYLFDRIIAFFRAAAEARPLVLVLDDLHWADAPSLLLLSFLAREALGARILVLGTYRDADVNRTHALTRALSEIARIPGSVRLALSGLEPAVIAEFVRSLCGIVPPQAVVAAVARQTEGNPFFVSEVVRLLEG